MGHYRKRPVEVEARQVDSADYDGMCEIVSWCGGNTGVVPEPYLFEIQTLEGPHFVSAGDWIVKGVKGEFYPVKPDIFEQTYEEIT